MMKKVVVFAGTTSRPLELCYASKFCDCSDRITLFLTNGRFVWFELTFVHLYGGASVGAQYLEDVFVVGHKATVQLFAHDGRVHGRIMA